MSTVKKKKSYQARKNEGNNLFFLILHNILTDKSSKLYYDHINNVTFDDVYTLVGVEKALSKCYDNKIVIALSKLQTEYSKINDKSFAHGNFKQMHYWYLLNKLPKTFQSIDWKLDSKTETTFETFK